MRKRNWKQRLVQPQFQPITFRPLHGKRNIHYMGGRKGSEPAQAAAACVAALALTQNQPVGDWGPAHVDAAIDAGRQAHRETVQRLRAARQRFDERAIGPLDLQRDFFVGIHRYEVCTRVAHRGRCGAQSGTPDQPSLAEALQRLYDAAAESPCAVLELDGPPPRRFVAAWLDRGRTDYYYLLDPAPERGGEAVVFQCWGFQALIESLQVRLSFGDETPYVLYHVKLMGQISFGPPPVPPPAAMPYDEARALSPPKKKDTAKKSRREESAAAAPATPAVRVQEVPQQQQQQIRLRVDQPTPFRPPDAMQYEQARALSAPGYAPGAAVQQWPVTRAQEMAAPPQLPFRQPLGVQQRLTPNPRLECAYANLPTRFKFAQRHERVGNRDVRTPTSTMILQCMWAPRSRLCMSSQSLVALAVTQVRPPLAWQDDDIRYAMNVGARLYEKMLDEDNDFEGPSAWAFRDARLEIENEKLIVRVDHLTAAGPIRSNDPRVPGLEQALRWFFDDGRDVGGHSRCELRIGADLSLGIYKDEQKCFWLCDLRPHDADGQLITVSEQKGLATLFRLLGIDELLERLLPSLRNEVPVYQLRWVDFLPDLPGTIDWHRFRPYRYAASWILRGSPGLHAASAERFDAANHDRQSLGTATSALVASHRVRPSGWDASTIDLAVIEGDTYYTWCTMRDNEGPNEPERKLRPSNMRLVTFHDLRKCRFRVREQAVQGTLCPGDQLLQSLRFFFYELGEDRCIFEALNGTEPIRYLGLWAWREELDNGIMDWTWYLFHDHATSQLARAALGDQFNEEISAIAPEQESGCVLRFSRLEDVRDVLVALFCRSQDDDDDDDRYMGGSLPQQQQEQAPGQEVAFSMHALLVDSIETQRMNDDELAREMSRSVIPEASEYARDTPTSGHLLGSQHGTVARYVHRQVGWTRAGTALAALAMRHLCNPFEWTTLTVDTLLDLGDVVSAKWRSEIRDEDDAAAAADNDPDAGSGEQAPPQPRDYLLPHEIGSIQLGTSEIGLATQQILDDEERQATIRQQLCRHLEELFELTYQAVLRSGRAQLAVWRFDGVYFALEPSGNEANRYLAGVYYWLELEGLCAFLAPILLDAAGAGGEIQTYGVSVDSIGNVPESARPNVTKDAVKQDWYNWSYVKHNHWTIEYDEETTYEDLHLDSDTSLCAVFIMMSQIHEPHQWSTGLLRQAVILARGLHMLNAERLGKDRKFTPYEMISEFYIANRQIRLVLEDCVAHGRPDHESFEDSLNPALDRYHGVILNATAPGCEYYWAIWWRGSAYYVLTPSKGVVRKKELDWMFFAESLALQWQMTAVNVTNCEFVRHLVDPSPAIAPSVLPPMNAYRPITMRYGPELPARGILQASVSQENVHELLGVAPHPSYQTSATCAMAVAATLLHDPSMWTKGNLDDILIWGYQLHQQTLNGGDPDSFNINGSTVHIIVNLFANVTPGTTKWYQKNEEEERKKAEEKKAKEKKEEEYVEEEEGEEGVTLRPDQNKISDLSETLMKCFKRFFKGSNNSMILRIDRFMVAIWRSGSAYFIFDPEPRDDRGLVLPPFEEGNACVIWYCALEPLVELIIANFPQATWSSIHIYQIRVWRAQPRQDDIPQPVGVTIAMTSQLDRLVRRAELFVPRVRAGREFHRQLLRPVTYIMDPNFRTIRADIKMKIEMEFYWLRIRANVLQASLHLRSMGMPQSIAGRQSCAVALVALALARIQSPINWSARTLDYVINNGNALHAERQRQLGAPVEHTLDVVALPRSLQLGGRVRLQARPLENPQCGVWAGREAHLAACLEQHFRRPTADYGILEVLGNTSQRFALAIIRSEGRYYVFDPTGSNLAVTNTRDQAALIQCRSTQQLAECIFVIYHTPLGKSECDIGEFEAYMAYAFDMSASFD